MVDITKEAQFHKDKTVTKCFRFHKEFVTCTKCRLNYSGRDNGKRTFCQEFSRIIDPKEVEFNEKTATTCHYFVPDGLSRYILKSKERERWYEKDSIA